MVRSFFFWAKCRKDSSTSSTVLPAISEGSFGAGVAVVVGGGVVVVKLVDIVVLFYPHNMKRKVSIKFIAPILLNK